MPFGGGGEKTHACGPASSLKFNPGHSDFYLLYVHRTFSFFNLLFLSPKINFCGLAKSVMYLLETDFWTVPTHPHPLTLLGSRINVYISFYIL